MCIRDRAYTEGKIVKIDFTGGTVAYHSIIFKYKVGEEEYRNSIAVSHFKCNFGKKKDYCLGEIFTVKYSLEDPSVSEIDLREFNEYKYYKPSF